MNNIYKKYKERLVEISGKNRSLFSKKIGRQYAFDIGKILKKDSENTSLFLEFLLKGKRTGFTLISKDTRQYLFDALKLNEKVEKKFLDKTKMTADQARSENLRRERLKKEEIKKANVAQVNNLRILKREVEEFAKETGRYEMFVGYPFVQGELNKDTMIKGPLVLFPVTISIRDEFTVDLEFKKDEPVQLNKVFILAYAKQHKLVIDDLVQEFDANNKFNFKSVKEVIDYLSKFGFKLKYTERVSLDDFEDGGEPHRGDKLTVKNYAVVGRFPLANSIYNDYVTLEKSKLSTPAIDMLLNNKEMPKAKNVSFENYPITEGDYAQQKSLDEINKFGNVVIFGPPGTGKSQSIVNIISDSIAKGKTVLVVSQKKVAMDVVYNRLGTLANRTMYITDIDKSSAMFYDKVKRAHNEVLSKYSQESVQKHEKISQDVSHEVAHLEELSGALFNNLAYGVSLQKLYSTTPQVQKGTFEFDIYKSLLENTQIMAFDYATLKDVTEKIRDKKKDKLYHKYEELKAKNNFVSYLNMDINIEDQNALKVFVQKLLESQLTSFDFGKYSKLKSLLFMTLSTPDLSEKDVDKVIKIIAKTELNREPSKTRKDISSKCQELRKQFAELENDVDKFVGETKLLKKTLTADGYSQVVDNILCGTTIAIKKLNDALQIYATIKDLMQNLQTLSYNERMVIEFAHKNSKSEEEMSLIITKLLNIRNYHEIVKAEEQENKKLSFILDYENTKERIINLKSELLDTNKDIAYVSFNDKYSKFYSSRKDNKDYLYVINKQENMWNIRKTMEYFSSYLLKLFPCWMMSPENVSSVMPLKPDLFDVIVFDEASQIFIENSIPTIYRGKSVAIAGDRKQLKPTTTFMKRYIGNENFEELSLTEQAALEVESLLDLATSRFTNANLTYHYRSKYEELINFSNYAFYDEKLQIAPNISKNVHKPIERIKVNGVWIDRRNHEEAVEVVKLIKKLLKTRDNNQTIGVITFNTEQENYIEDIIDVECQKDPEFREAYLKEANRKENGEDTGLFIKNIENVQGEERDIIIFSVGYAKNERGKIVAQFGALSMEGGENRLNVAVTRAKEKIYLITSIEPEDLNVSYSKNIGPKVLKKYLQYARAVSFDNKYEQKIILESLRKKTIIEEQTTEGLEQEIMEALTKKKYIVDTNIGNAKYKINLAVYNKKLDRYVLGIEIDSNAYHSSESLLERDVYRTKFLNSRGWNMMRLWSRDWWTDKEKTIALIEDNIAKAIEKINKEKIQAKKNKTKKIVEKTVTLDENPLATNLFEKQKQETQVISTRLSKKVLARLEEDKENEKEIEDNIKKINENADYNLVLEPILTSEELKAEKSKNKKPRKSKKNTQQSTLEQPKIEEQVSDIDKQPETQEPKLEDNNDASEKKQKALKKSIAKDEPFIDEVEAKYESKKLKAEEKKARKADKLAIRQEKSEERLAKKQEKIEQHKRKKEELKLAKEEARKEKELAKKEKQRQAQRDKKYNKKEISKAKSQLDSLSKITSLKNVNKDETEKQSQSKNSKSKAKANLETIEKMVEAKKENSLKNNSTQNTNAINTKKTLSTLELLKKNAEKKQLLNIESKAEKVADDKNTNASSKPSEKVEDKKTTEDVKQPSQLQSLLTRLQKKDK